MSTILEALKKSEQERNQKQVPTLVDKPPPPERLRWPWVAVSTVLLLMALALTYLFVQLPAGVQSQSNGAARSAATPETIASNDDFAAIQTNPEQVSVEVISWSPQAQQRFAMINGKLFREGDYLRTGVLVERIEQEHVVINSRGDLVRLKP